MTRTVVAIPAFLLALAACGGDRERPTTETTAPVRSVAAPSEAAASGASHGSSVCRGLKRERAQFVRAAAAAQAGPVVDQAAAEKAQAQVDALTALITDACQ